MHDRNLLRGRLVARAYLGDRSHYYVAVDGLEKPLAVAAQNVTRSLDGGTDAGREVWIGWSKAAAMRLPHG